MKILHFLIGRCNPDSANGVEKTVANLTKELGKIPGNKVYLFSTTDKEVIPIANVEIYRFPKLKYPFILPSEMKTMLENIAPDIIHLHSVYSPNNIVFARWARELNIPYVTTPNGGLDQNVMKRKLLLKKMYQHLFELPYSNRAAFVHSVGDTKAILDYGIKTKIVEIPNGIDLDKIPEAPSENPITKLFPQTAGKKILMFMGRLDPLHKGLDLLINGFAQAKLKKSVLLLVGPDFKSNKTKLENLTRELQVNGNVIFTGPIYGNQKYGFLKYADVFIHTSRWEGMPFSVLEAMAMKLPCLVTPPANPMGKIINRNSGWVASVEANDIAQKLREIENTDAEKLRKMGEENYRLIKDYFLWSGIAGQIQQEYKNIINKRIKKNVTEKISTN